LFACFLYFSLALSLVFLEEVTNYIDSGYSVDVIYLDFQKAFDKVTHRRLIMKLEVHENDGEILQWIVWKLVIR